MKPALIALLMCLSLPLAGAEKDKPLPKDLKSLKALAEVGDARAQGQLARNYTYGKGVKQNYVEALKWARKAATQENSDGQFVVGRSYHLGNAVEKSSREAAKWYRKAAEQGHAYAQNNLGLCMPKVKEFWRTTRKR